MIDLFIQATGLRGDDPDHLAGREAPDHAQDADGQSTLLDTMSRPDGLHLGSGRDRFDGSDNPDAVYGDGGDDTLRGNGGRDTLGGGNGNDGLSGGQSRDVLHGGNGDDDVSGSAARDRLFGGAGGDSLFAGVGRDMIVGGSGGDVIDPGADEVSDRLVYRSVSDSSSLTGIDHVTVDFDAGSDIIDLRRIDADASTLQDDAFTWIGSAEFSGTSGELRYADQHLQGDVDGDGVADLDIAFFFVTSDQLTVADILL